VEPARSQRSAIILPVAEAEALVADWRERWDPTAAMGVPAHITLLFPFLPVERIVEADVARLAAWFKSVPSTEITLARTGRFEGVLYLAPEPEAFLRALTATLWSMYPETPPYGGLYQDPAPHLTVAQTDDASVLDQAERELAGRLPVKCQAAEAWLLQEDADGRWSRRERFRLGAEIRRRRFTMHRE
jgi:2'-5' RNA ligase